MAKFTRATSWRDVVDRDYGGAILSVDYTCPHCRSTTGELIFVGDDKDRLDDPWETDQVCGVCGRNVTIVVLDPPS